MGTTALMMVMFQPALTQFYQEERAYILNEINRARSNPVEYGIEIGLERKTMRKYRSTHPLQHDDHLHKKAEEWALYLLTRGILKHSNMSFRESVLYTDDYRNAVHQFIGEVAAKPGETGHRDHLLNPEETLIGIGIARGWAGRHYRTYVVILTN